ncbi:T6SS phospholipase effector Tle1-like catalytic domain-containing protein [Lysobacter sp. A289]
MSINATHPGDVGGIRALRPVRDCRADQCEVRINIGLFFDGTGNNARWVEPGTVGNQEARRKDSNVFRLWAAYPDNPTAGLFRSYVPGVGTPFSEIGEHEPADLGMGFGGGGEGRIVFGLLQVLNAMHRVIERDRPMFQPAVVEALCGLGREPSMPERHRLVLRPLGMTSGGLLSDWPSGLGARRPFLQSQGALLAEKIARTDKPKLVEVFIDVFGFSRGAAEARVFCHWLDELFQGNRLFGVQAHIRFVGLFDTVASVGVPTSATPFTDGHMDWADAEHLRIPRRAGHCEHYIAAHENRGSFPVDEVLAPSGALPSNCRQFVFPGMHSDVGGGYTPQEQGRGPRSDNAEKLAQIPLNHMYDAARAARVPLDKTLAVQGLYDPYQIAPELQAAYDGWRAENSGSKPLREWLLPYLAWRYQARHRYGRLPAFERASARDRDDLHGANATLLADIHALENPPSAGTRAAESLLGTIPGFGILARHVIARDYDCLAPEATAVLQRIKSAPPTPPASATLYADYAHDSFAGFRPFDSKIMGIDPPGSWEPEGYLRWRVHYRGNDTRLTRRTGVESNSQVA